jgi:hypothetical protein
VLLDVVLPAVPALVELPAVPLPVVEVDAVDPADPLEVLLDVEDPAAGPVGLLLVSSDEHC